MTQYSEAGKGSQQRPTDQQKYDENYDLIFRKYKETLASIPAADNGDKNSTEKGEI